MSNLNPSYQLRLDRVRRLREGYVSGRLTAREFRICMAQEGFTDARDVAPMDTIGAAALRVVQRLEEP